MWTVLIAWLFGVVCAWPVLAVLVHAGRKYDDWIDRCHGEPVWRPVSPRPDDLNDIEQIYDDPHFDLGGDHG